MSFEPGQVIDGKYRITRVLGAGGMGAVYEGENVRIGRKVAIKVLHAEAAHAPDLRRRFEREARVAAKIGSHNICDVIDLGDLPDGHAYLVMEYLEGETLEDILNREVRVRAHFIAPLAMQLLDGLSAMHGANIIHRDMKPANVFVTTNGVVKILDFGISKFQVQADAMTQNTQTGALMGTPLYMSPEQSRGARDVDGRSDIYCVGVILYRALSGGHCFEADNLPQLLFKTALEEPIPLRPHLLDQADEPFVAIVERAMAKQPADRYATAREMRDAIETWVRECHPEVPLPVAPARVEDLLEVSGARPKADLRTGSSPSFSGAVSAVSASSGGVPAVSTATPSVKELAAKTEVSGPSPALSPAAASLALAPGAVPEGPVQDTANGWESTPLGGAGDPALARTSAAPPAMGGKSSSKGLYIGLAAAALVAIGAGFALKGPPAASANNAPPPPPSAVVPVPSAPTPSATVAEAPKPAPEPSATVAAPAEVAPSPSATAKVAVTTKGGPSKAAASATATPATPPPAEAATGQKPGRKIRTEL